MPTKYITERIREYYCADKSDDEWLVEKGKVKEGRMLKEACIEIERLQKRVVDQMSKLNKKWAMKNQERSDITTPLNLEIHELKERVTYLTRTLNNVNDATFYYRKENKNENE